MLPGHSLILGDLANFAANLRLDGVRRFYFLGGPEYAHDAAGLTILREARLHDFPGMQVEAVRGHDLPHLTVRWHRDGYHLVDIPADLRDDRWPRLLKRVRLLIGSRQDVLHWLV